MREEPSFLTHFHFRILPNPMIWWRPQGWQHVIWTTTIDEDDMQGDTGAVLIDPAHKMENVILGKVGCTWDLI